MGTECLPSTFCHPLKHCDSGIYGISNGCGSIIQQDSDKTNCHGPRCESIFIDNDQQSGENSSQDNVNAVETDKRSLTLTSIGNDDISISCHYQKIGHYTKITASTNSKILPFKQMNSNKVITFHV